MAYSKLAYVYDVLMDDAPYNEWHAFVDHFIARHLPNSKNILDLGCGTGRMSDRFAQVGYQVTGVDFSEDMLAYAEATTSDVQYIQQDIRYLEGLSNYDVVISLCDVINYITDEKELANVFKNVSATLNEKGLFIFDVHSLRHFEEDMMGATFAEIYDDISYVWFCEEGETEGSVEHDLTFFLLNENSGEYERFDEKHKQRTFHAEKYVQLLKEAGLTTIGVYGDFSVQPSENPEQNERVFFVCQK